MNNSADPAEIRELLSQITGSAIDESLAVFTPLYINYGKHTKIGKNVFINFDCVFLDLGVTPPEMNSCCRHELQTSDDPIAHRGNKTLVSHLRVDCSSLLEFYCPKPKATF